MHGVNVHVTAEPAPVPHVEDSLEGDHERCVRLKIRCHVHGTPLEASADGNARDTSGNFREELTFGVEVSSHGSMREAYRIGIVGIGAILRGPNVYASEHGAARFILDGDVNAHCGGSRTVGEEDNPDDTGKDNQ
jgi:hypothetical protein